MKSKPRVRQGTIESTSDAWLCPTVMPTEVGIHAFASGTQPSRGWWAFVHRAITPGRPLRMLLIGACLGTLTLATPVNAQPNDSNINFDAGALMSKKQKPGLPDVRAQPLAWPRLDPGAVFCRSEADLERLAARRGGQAVDGTIDCQIIRTPTAISIVQRNGPGRVEVQISGAKGGAASGWTDAWLPDKAPPGATSASR